MVGGGLLMLHFTHIYSSHMHEIPRWNVKINFKAI